jgi:hypothetical protein
MNEVGARWSRRIRSTHRWTSIVFTVVVACLTVASAVGTELPEWAYYVPLPLLLVLILTGLYLFALPYLGRRRGGREGEGRPS